MKIKSLKLPEYLYHGTYYSALSGIQEFGLGSSAAETVRAYDDPDGVATGDYVYLTPDESSAFEFADSGSLSDGSHVVVLRVATSDLDLNKLEVDPYLEGEDASIVNAS